jgi:hypothetical protein
MFSTIRRRIFAIFGLILLVLGLLGPLTFADDWRHLGEIGAAIGLALSGLFLLVPVMPVRWRCSNSFPLATPVILLGLVLGTLADKIMIGTLLGACLGLLVVGWHCAKYPRVDR